LHISTYIFNDLIYILIMQFNLIFYYYLEVGKGYKRKNGGCENNFPLPLKMDHVD